TVLVADPFVTVDDSDIEYACLEDILARADYVVCPAVANENTENLIGQAALARMRPHAFFINLSRGNLVDEAALTAALRDNRIAGAGTIAKRHRDAAYRRPDAAGDRKPVVRDGASSPGNYQWRGSTGCRQRR